MPELELPAFTAEDQLTAIALVCEGAIGYKDIKDREIFPVLREWLSKWQAKALDDYAPVSLKLSNGQTAKVRYEEDSTPVIGLTVQRLFGVTESPTIAGGKMIVKTEILAPNQRPWQLTTDLSGFWKHGYVQMKKDLAGRYPKHAWPDGADISRVPQLKRQNNGLGK
jgi:ATP-dependent helicase HrpB